MSIVVMGPDETINSIEGSKGSRNLSSSYQVINLDCEKLLSFCSQLLLLTGLEFVFFYSTMFDVFCVKISLVWVKYFVHNINLKKNKPFQIWAQISPSLPKLFFLDLLLFFIGLSSKCQICLGWRYLNGFQKNIFKLRLF